MVDSKELGTYLYRENPNDKKVRPEKYLVSRQEYQSGQPHYHVILVYPVRKSIETASHFDYRSIHPNIQLMRNLKAALVYVQKEDSQPYTNMNLAVETIKARARDSSSLYQLMEQQMRRDPFNFDVGEYCDRHDIFKQIYKANYTKAVRLIGMAQEARCRSILRAKPGIKLITPQLVRQRLSPEELAQFYSNPCYERIVFHVNQVHSYPNRNVESMAPSKTPHLLIVGDASIGKSALVDHRASTEHPYPGLMHYYSTYHLSIGQKYFPLYRSFDYSLVRWNEFTIDSDLFPKSGYNRLLDYLEGAPSALPQKGRAPVERQDNPKHILTSNKTLTEHIHSTFRTTQNRQLALRNLGTRVECVVIPKGKSIHFLRKLFVTRD